jgi:hypothetical protein
MPRRAAAGVLIKRLVNFAKDATAPVGNAFEVPIVNSIYDPSETVPN